MKKEEKKLWERRKKLYNSMDRSFAASPSPSPSEETLLKDTLEAIMNSSYHPKGIHWEIEFEEDEKLNRFFGHSKHSTVFKD